MKFTAPRKELLKAARNARKAVDAAPAASIKGLLLTASMETGLICFTGTNILTSIQARISTGRIEENGATIVPSTLITDIFAKFSGEQVCCYLYNNVLQLECDSCSFIIPTMPSEKFPQINMPVPSGIIKVNRVRQLMQRTVIAASTRPSEQSLQSVKLSFSVDQTRTYAFDGFRMINASSRTCADGSLDVIIHCTALNILCSNISNDDDLYVGIAQGYAVFFKPDLIFSTFMPEGVFKSISSITSQRPVTAYAEVDSSEFLRCVEMAVSALLPVDDQCVTIKILDKELEISTTTALNHSAVHLAAAKTLPTPADGYHFSPKLLLDYIKQASGPMSLTVYGEGFFVITANQCSYAMMSRSAAAISLPKAQKAAKGKKKAPKKTEEKPKEPQQQTEIAS